MPRPTGDQSSEVFYSMPTTPTPSTFDQAFPPYDTPIEDNPFISARENLPKRVMGLKVSKVIGRSPFGVLLRDAASTKQEDITNHWRDRHDCNPHCDDCPDDCEDCSCDCNISDTHKRRIDAMWTLTGRIETKLTTYFTQELLVDSDKKIVGSVFHHYPGIDDPLIKEIRCSTYLSGELLVVFKDGTTKLVDMHSILAVIYPQAGGDTCSQCGISHTAYGIEAELSAMTEDPDARNLMLKRLNRKLRLDKASDKYGVDGGGGNTNPLEMRNMNGTSIHKVTSTYSRTFKKMMGGIDLMNKNFNHVGKDISTFGCGLHIHQFHLDTPRAPIVTAHSLVGMLVNSMETDIWASRAQSGYGTPFNHRSPTPWCESDHATELRMFNVLHPKTLEACMELTMELAKLRKDTDVNIGGSDGRGGEFEKFMMNRRLSTTSVVSKSVFNRALAFFVKKEIATPSEIKTLFDRIAKEYIPPLPSMKGRKMDVLIDEKKITVIEKKSSVSFSESTLSVMCADAHRQRNRCNDMNPEGMHRFVCTRRAGHEGHHHAHAGGGEDCCGTGNEAIWPQHLL